MIAGSHAGRLAILRIVPIAILLAAAPGKSGNQPQATPLSIAYPPAARDSVIDDYHGTPVADPYRWLEDSDTPRTAAWLEGQIRLTTDELERIEEREAIRKRLTELSGQERTGVPWREAGRLFHLRSTGLEPQPVLCTLDNLDDPSTVLLDPNAISPDGSTAIGDFVVSPDGRLLAYSRAEGGADAAGIHVREIATGRDLPDVVEGVSACWTHDGRGFFYVRSLPAKPGQAPGPRIAKQTLYHAVGQPVSEDRLILEWKENARWVYCMTSEDGRYALVVAEEGTASEIYAIDLGDPARPDLAAEPVKLLGSAEAFHTPVDFVGSTLYVRTNFQAPRNRVVALDLENRADAEPRPVIPEASGVIVDAIIAGDRIVVNYLEDVKSRLRLFALDGKPEGDIDLPGVGAVGWPLSGRPSTAQLFYTFTSFLNPATVYHYDFGSGKSTPFRPPALPFDRERYETTQVFYPSRDGTRVPMFITAAKGLVLDGSHPVLLTGYGGYGASMEPEYRPDIPLWLERGGLYVVANIRGGGEYGEEWHRAGMLDRKQTSFDDFIAAAEYLVGERYTSPDRLALYGQSNGGLLVGAVLTQRPDLFAAAVANAGHYDMLRYHRFTAGAAWTTEYGSPDDPSAFPYLRTYSPLHNVRDGVCYPATLLLVADHDDRVVPGHGYKFAAALQAAQACARPVLLRVAVNASHGYASRQEQIAERTDMWAFVSAHLGAGGR